MRLRWRLVLPERKVVSNITDCNQNRQDLFPIFGNSASIWRSFTSDRCFGVSVFRCGERGGRFARVLSLLYYRPTETPTAQRYRNTDRSSGTEPPAPAAHHRFRTLGERVIRPIFDLRPSTSRPSTLQGPHTPLATSGRPPGPSRPTDHGLADLRLSPKAPERKTTRGCRSGSFGFNL